ncbi:MAG: sigma-70 family RNA polymerase sigma factor [Gemmatales bacterium]|nr:sigma-70 family RNA polymerase sigma factor [Gemmatales bacterium]MDW7993555.1 sigma-70 family RNA polymerase sigma factor [Gemmatales bacterium]
MDDLTELVSKALNQDPEASAKLFEHLKVRVRKIAARMLGLKRDASVTESDLLQELNIRVWKMLQSEPSVQDAQHFLTLAGRHLRWAALELLRRLPPRRSVSLEEHQSSAESPDRVILTHREDPYHHPDRQEAWECFHQPIGQEGILDENERMVVTLRWYHGLKQKAIAEVMKVSERTGKRY